MHLLIQDMRILNCGKVFLGFYLSVLGVGDEVSNAAFMYLHAAVNGIQGIIVFFIYCVSDDVTRKEVMSCCSKSTSDNEE